MSDVDGETTHEKTVNLIEKQLSRGHYGPFEHPQITFSVKGISRVTMAQLTRHRFLTADVQSQRYANFEDADIVVPASLLTAEERHNRYPHVFDEDGTHISREKGLVDIEEGVREYYREEYERTTQHELDQYQSMVEAGIPKEDARFILPEGTPVNLTVSGNARTFLHLLDMRKKANSQWEIHELAAAMLDELFDWMPITYSYYEEHGPNRLSP
jgi:thymidylate synthase (FAD)